MGRLGSGELLIVLVVVLVLFGGTKLPQLGASLGQAIRNFKRGFGGEEGEEEKKAQGMMADNPGAPRTEADRARAPSKIS